MPLGIQFGIFFLTGFFASAFVLSFVLASFHVREEKKALTMGIITLLCFAIGTPIISPLIGFLSRAHYIKALYLFPISFLLSIFIRKQPSLP